MKNNLTQLGASILIISLFLNTQLHAQFESKKAKALYGELVEAYDAYDYELILDKEADIQKQFSSYKDTVSLNAQKFLAETYLVILGDAVASLDIYSKVLDASKSIGASSESIKNLQYNVASLKDELGYYNESEALYLEVLESDKKNYGKKSPEYVETALALSIHYQYRNMADESLAILKDIDGLVDKESEQYALILNAFGNSYFFQGNYNQSERYFNKALDLFELLGLNPSIDYLGPLNGLYDLYMDTGRYPDAEEILLYAIDMVAKLQGDNSDINSILYHNIAEVYRILGNYSEGEEYIKESIEIQKELGGDDSPLVAQDMMTLASIYDYAGKYELSEKTHKEAMSILESSLGTEDFLFQKQKFNLASVYRKTGRLDEALRLTKEATEAFLEIFGEENYDYVFGLFRMGQTYQMLGDNKAAEKTLNDGLKVGRKILGKNHPEYTLGTKQLAILKWDEKELDETKKLFEETFDNYFTQIDAYFPTLSEEEKAKFYNSDIKVSFEQFNSFAAEHADKIPELKSIMYNYQLATKGLIMYATNKVRESIMNSGDSSLMEKYDTWIGQKEQLSKLFSTHEGDIEARNKKIDSLLNASNDLEKELGRLSKTFASNMTKKDLTWKDVQEKLKDDEAAIEMIRFRKFDPDSAGRFSDKVFYAALIIKKNTKDYPEMVILENGELMEKRYLANYRNAIRYKVNEDYSYRLFWKPISEKIDGINKVYFSPDGVYNQISIYTLRNSETKNFLVDEVDIQVLTNTKDLVAFEYDEDSKFDKSDAYLFGFPNYNMGSLEIERDEEAIKKSAQSIASAASQGRGSGRSVSRGARGARGTRGEQGTTRSGGLSRGVRGNLQRYVSGSALLSLLPGTKKEVELIQDLYEGQSFKPEVYLSNEAIEEQVKKVDSPQMLHIATHGFFLENEEPEEGQEVDEYVENPLLRSGLIFAGANSFISTGVINEENDAEEDGILTAYEAMNMNLDDTELVVLSACETGLGEISNGEGVYGLQRAFQIAGAESIIMSMWTVDDDATQELMTTFYEKWIETGNKQIAFNTAQKVIKDKWKAPYYWGAFVMVGL